MSSAVVELALPLSAKATQLFAERGIESARLEAELLLAHVLGIKRLDLYLQHDRPLTEAQLQEFRTLVRRRLKREPLQYIIGTVQFRELELRVDRRALIPRPETEVLVGEVLKFAATRPDDALAVVDMGTGTGAIALSIKHECSRASVLAVDVSREALALAGENADARGLAIDFACGALWDAVPADASFDVVVSNPPYIAEAERTELQPEVVDWEPGVALFAGDDGLAVIRLLIAGAPQHMNDGALLALEVGAGQAERVQQLMAATSSLEEIHIVRDLSGRERIVTAICRKRAV